MEKCSENFQSTCQAIAVGEKQPIHFYSLCQSVPLYPFKLANIFLQRAVKEFFEIHF